MPSFGRQCVWGSINGAIGIDATKGGKGNAFGSDTKIYYDLMVERLSTIFEWRQQKAVGSPHQLGAAPSVSIGCAARHAVFKID